MAPRSCADRLRSAPGADRDIRTDDAGAGRRCPSDVIGDQHSCDRAGLGMVGQRSQSYF